MDILRKMKLMSRFRRSLLVLSLVVLINYSDGYVSESETNEHVTYYKGKMYKVTRLKSQDPHLECQIPPLEEEDLTHFRKKRMIAQLGHGRVCIEDYPYTVSIRYNDSHICTGAIIENQYVLTVYDCVKDVNDTERPVELSVRAGSPYRDAGGSLFSVPKMFIHPKNGTGNYSHRIVILKTNVYITPTPAMIPVELPFPRMLVPDKGHLVVTGYGNYNETGELIEYEEQWFRRTWVRNLTTNECMERLGLNQNQNLTRRDLTDEDHSTTSSTSPDLDISKPDGEEQEHDQETETVDNTFYDDYICIERYNETEDELYLCDGDFGVPLVYFNGSDISPVIMGLSVTAMKGCVNETLNKGADGKLKPGIFLKVAEYRGWIHSVIKNEEALEEEEGRGSPNECELEPSFSENYRYLRRKKRLTTETDLACLEDYPYTVSVRLHGMHWCGGAIIGDNWVLTSAQCFDDTNKEDVTVRMGSVFRDYGGRIVSVTALVKHPQYRRGDDYPAHNLAMLQINMPVMPNARIQIVKLIPPITVRIERWGGENVVTGYGSVASTLLEEGVNQELRRMTVTRLPISDCQEAYRGITRMKEDHVCLKSVNEGVNLCTGDLGSPLVQFSKYTKGGILFGLAMFPGNVACNSSRPAVFTRIRPSRKWIDTVLREGPPAETEPPPTTKVPVLRQAETTTSRFVHNLNYAEKLEIYKSMCQTRPRFQVDLRQVNLTAHRRRKRSNLYGKDELACLEDYPYTVAILKNDNEVICSGVIIAKQWVLTAAMCLETCNLLTCDKSLRDISQLSIRMGSIFGSKGGRVVPVIDFRIHPNYNWDGWQRDSQIPVFNLAMLKFNIPYRSSPRMQQVLLPTPQISRDRTTLETLTTGRYIVAGFSGKKSSQPEDGFSDLRAIEMVPLEYTKCQNNYIKVLNYTVYNHRVGYDPWFNQYEIFCMSGKKRNFTFCEGDSGMPLLRFNDENSRPVLEGILVIVQQVPQPQPNPPCPLAYLHLVDRIPALFVRVDFDLNVNWIEKELAEDYNNTQWYIRPTPGGYPMIWY